jgi:hypothetical protein
MRRAEATVGVQHWCSMRLSRLGEPIELDPGSPHGSFQDELRDPFEKSSRAPDRWPQGCGVAACARPPGLITANTFARHRRRPHRRFASQLDTTFVKSQAL